MSLHGRSEYRKGYDLPCVVEVAVEPTRKLHAANQTHQSHRGLLHALFGRQIGMVMLQSKVMRHGYPCGASRNSTHGAADGRDTGYGEKIRGEIRRQEFQGQTHVVDAIGKQTPKLDIVLKGL